MCDELKMCSPMVSCMNREFKKLSDRKERFKLIQFLMEMNDIYSVVRGQIILTQPLSIINKVYSLLSEKEKQKVLIEYKITEQVHAMNIKSSNFKKLDSLSQRQDFSWTWTFGSSKTQGSKKWLHYTYCDGNTHIINRFFFLIGFPIGHNFHGKIGQPPDRAWKVSINQTGA